MLAAPAPDPQSERERTASLIEALSRPASYPWRPPTVECLETHISWLFLAGDRVLKVKKPVRFAFLDYRSLERRRTLCHEEVRLNARLAPDLYLGVRALVRHDGEWRLADGADDPEAAEYAVLMRRFEAERTLDRLLADRSAGPVEIRAVGRRLALFHTRARAAARASDWPPRLARAIDENVESLLPFAGEGLDVRQLVSGQRFFTAFLASRWSELCDRAGAGLVRDGHGDLRAEHVIVQRDGRLEIFDCVEFDPSLREIDVAADLAFLVMDLVALGRDDLAGELVEAYRAADGDPGDDRLLAGLAAYRAWVRAKVSCLRAAELDRSDPRRVDALASAHGLLAVGRRLAWRARVPAVVVICGGAASGKSHLARALADAGGVIHVEADVVRKRALGLDPTVRAPASAYDDAANLRTYRELGRLVAAELAAGRSVVADATFRRRGDRNAFAAELGPRTGALYVECRAPAEVLEARAARRAADARAVSDAAGALIAEQQREFAPLDEIPAAAHLIVRTDRPVEDVVDEIEVALDRRLAGP